MGMKFSEHEYKKTIYILLHAFKAAEGYGCSNEAISVLREMSLYTQAFYHNNQTNTKKNC